MLDGLRQKDEKRERRCDVRIGTDCSLKVCLEEGYTVMDFEARKLFPKGRKNGMDKDCDVLFSASLPEYARDPGIQNRGRAWKALRSWNDLLEAYKQLKSSIDSTCGAEIWPLDSDKEPNEYDLLNLGDGVNSYCGLQ